MIKSCKHSGRLQSLFQLLYAENQMYAPMTIIAICTIWSARNIHKSFRLLSPGTTSFWALVVRIHIFDCVYDFNQSVKKCIVIILRASHHPQKSHMAIHDRIPIIKECNHKLLPLQNRGICFRRISLSAGRNLPRYGQR